MPPDFCFLKYLYQSKLFGSQHIDTTKFYTCLSDLNLLKPEI